MYLLTITELKGGLETVINVFKFVEVFGLALVAGIVWFQRGSMDDVVSLGETVGLFLGCKKHFFVIFLEKDAMWPMRMHLFEPNMQLSIFLRSRSFLFYDRMLEYPACLCDVDYGAKFDVTSEGRNR